MHKQIELQIIYPQADENGQHAYPNSSIVVRLRSKVMPPDLVEKLLKMCEKTVKKLATADGGGQPQALVVFDFVKKIMENNNLIPAWNELQGIQEILRLKPESDEIKPDELKRLEKAGKLSFKIYQRAFFLEFQLTVPEEYPAKKPVLKFVSHNFDKNFAMLFEAQAQQIIRRSWEGSTPGYLPGRKKVMEESKKA